jgi:hypothetical protein
MNLRPAVANLIQKRPVRLPCQPRRPLPAKGCKPPIRFGVCLTVGQTPGSNRINRLGFARLGCHFTTDGCDAILTIRSYVSRDLPISRKSRSISLRQARNFRWNCSGLRRAGHRSRLWSPQSKKRIRQEVLIFFAGDFGLQLPVGQGDSKRVSRTQMSTGDPIHQTRRFGDVLIVVTPGLAFQGTQHSTPSVAGCNKGPHLRNDCCDMTNGVGSLWLRLCKNVTRVGICC